jgi:hypothetical protein
MTTRATAEALLFDEIPLLNKGIPAKADRHRVSATYCPRCSGWVEVRLQPVRLRCTGCGLEARP